MKKAPPLKVGGFVKNKLIPVRTKKHPSATPAAFKARARLFSLLEPARPRHLDRPSLMSSLHGGMARMLFTVPSWVFFPNAPGVSPEDSQLIQLGVQVFEHILTTLPSTCRITLLTNQATQQLAQGWLSDLGLLARSEIVAAEDTVNFSFWAQDAYCICKDMADDETYFVEPASFTRLDDAYVADVVAEQSDLESTQIPLVYQGGNVLTGDDFWFIGADYPLSSLELGLVVPKRGETDAEALARVYGSLMERERELVFIGSTVPVPPQEERPFRLKGEMWREVLYKGNSEGTVQPIFHIDMFISLAGRDTQGKYRVLVGSPQMAADLLGEELPDGAMQDAFDNIARGLSRRGFTVIRNPLPLIYDDDDTEKVRVWYFASGNNVLCQDNPKKVWIPTYGHGDWAKLSKIDRENAKIWNSLGYGVKLLPNCHIFAAKLGAAHCITKCLARQ